MEVCFVSRFLKGFYTAVLAILYVSPALTNENEQKNSLNNVQDSKIEEMKAPILDKNI